MTTTTNANLHSRSSTFKGEILHSMALLIMRLLNGYSVSIGYDAECIQWLAGAV